MCKHLSARTDFIHGYYCITNTTQLTFLLMSSCKKKKKKSTATSIFHASIVFFCLRRDSHSFLTFWNHKFRAASSEVTKRGSVGGLHTQSMSHTVLYRHSMLLCLHSCQLKALVFLVYLVCSIVFVLLTVRIRPTVQFNKKTFLWYKVGNFTV